MLYKLPDAVHLQAIDRKILTSATVQLHTSAAAKVSMADLQDRALFAKVEEVRTASSKWNDNSMILENLAISRLRGIDSADTARTGQAHRIITAAVLGDEAQGTSQPEGPYQSLCYSRYAAPVVPTITVEVATKEPGQQQPVAFP